MKRTLIACALSAIGCTAASDQGGEPGRTPEPIVKPAAQQRILPSGKPGAPVEIGADVGDATARLQIAFAAAATDVRVELRGTDGLRVTGGSRGVGLMTTRAVVMDIFMLICVDIAFAALFFYVLE